MPSPNTATVPYRPKRRPDAPYTLIFFPARRVTPDDQPGAHSYDVSPDGKYVAAVRNVANGSNGVYSYIYYSYAPTFGCISTSTITNPRWPRSSPPDS